MNTVLDVSVSAPWEGEVWVSGASKRGEGETQKRPDPVQVLGVTWQQSGLSPTRSRFWGSDFQSLLLKLSDLILRVRESVRM